MKVLNFGSLNLDHFFQVDHIVLPGETLTASAYETKPGGKGLNQSIALAKAGVQVFHAGCYGSGGEFLKQTLEDNGVQTDFLYRTDQPQGNALIQVDASGENSIILYAGSNACIDEKQVRETLESFEKGDWLFLQNEISCLPLIIDEAYAKGLTIVLNPSPFNEKLNAVSFEKISWLIVNEIEAKELCGSDDPETAVNMLHQKYPQLNFVITFGEAGSIGFLQGEKSFQPSYPVNAVDTTGAGDTYTGYFFAALIEGRSLSECMKRAAMASAIAVTRPGAAASIPAKDEVETALQDTKQI